MSSEQSKQQMSDISAPKVRANVKSGVKENWYLRRKDGKKREEWKRKMSSRKKFKPHLGIESLSVVTEQFLDLAKFAQIDLADDLIRKVEGIVALLLNLQHCTTYQHFTSATFLYIRDFYDHSITTQVMMYLETLFGESNFDKQSDSDGEPNWLSMVRNLQTNWSLVKSNRAFKQFSKLLSILITLGLCDISNIPFEIAGFKLFDEEILKRHVSAYDMADALFGTVTYFAEGAYLCFKTGSLRPLLLNDFSAMELDEEYTNIITWWDLIKNGNLERVIGMSDAEFSNRLNALINRLSNLMCSLSGFDKNLVASKITKCKTIKNELITLKISSGTRKSPFAIELFGDSNQGKTTFGDQLVDALLTSCNLPVDKQYRAAITPGDKFFSTWTSDKLVAVFDDLANEKSEFVERPPTRAIIDFCNNQMYYAPKAELDAKGKCFVEPEVVLVTTNKKDLDAYAYSNCPYSIQRRMDLVITVECKAEFQRVTNGVVCGVDSAKIREHYTIDGEYCPAAIDDIWEITIEQAVKPRSLTSTATYTPITWRGKTMEKVSAVEAIQCAIEHIHVHRSNQAAIMDHMRKRSNTLCRCPMEGCSFLKGYCPDHVHEQQFGLQTAIAFENIRRRLFSKANTDVHSFTSRIESAVTKSLYKKTNDFLEKWDWICLIPSEYLEDERVSDFLQWYYRDDMERNAMTLSYTNILLSLILIVAYWPLGVTLLFCNYITGRVIGASRTKYTLMEELSKRNDNLPFIIKNARDKYAKALCYGSAGIASLYLLSRVYRAWRSIQPTQGSLEPNTPEQVMERDSEINVWSNVVRRPLPSTKWSQSTTPERLSNVIQNNLLYASVEGDTNRTLMANVLMLKSNVMVLPIHYFDEGSSLKLTCHKVHPESVGGKFVARVDKTSSYFVPNSDLALCYVTTGGSYKDLSKFLPTGEISDHPFGLQWRKKNGDLIHAKGFANARQTTNGTCLFDGGEYSNLTINTFGGMCGAVLVSETKSAVLTGFHLGGTEGTPFGCFGTLTLQQFNVGIESLIAREGVLLSGSGNNFEPQMLGVKVLNDQPLHAKSPMNYLPKDSQFEYYGSCPGNTTSRSDVRKTPISDVVAEVTGSVNVWGKPKMKPEWFGWQTCLANASKPGEPFPHELLAKSIRDYKRPLIDLARSKMWQAQPLSDHDNLCGIPGCKFIDAINLSTSIGYPLIGPKRKYIVELEPEEGKPNNRVLEPVIMEEIRRLEETYRKGERAYTIAKACKKDEVLPTKKEKCRIFYGNPIALTFLVRKYYLPVLRFLQMNPLLSECAVGINSHGPEWDEFHKHVMHFGAKTLFGGDYGKYDQKLPSQLLLASLRILIDISCAMGYNQSDRGVMQAMSGDLVYSLIAFNGDLVGLQSGTHISGNSLTVILNGVSGSLNLRNYFYSHYSEKVAFRDAAHMMTYGDDNIGSVSPKYPKFNIRGCSEFLKEYGQTYTMPDKESDLQDYLNEDEFEFLKRASVLHPKLGVSLGALLEDSIFKSLHCYLRPRGCILTPNEACAQNIDTALREWFNHGEELYEKRRAQMLEIATKCEISHMCTLLHDSYNDRVNDWHCRYSGNYCSGER